MINILFNHMTDETNKRKKKEMRNFANFDIYLSIAHFVKIKHFEIKKPFKIVYLFNKIQKIFLSEKYNKRSFIKILDLSLDLNDRSITYNNLKLQLTEKEVEFILFLKKNNKPVTIESLLKNVWKYSKGIETHTIETHVHRLRKKILEKFNLNNIIKSNKKGYYI